MTAPARVAAYFALLAIEERRLDLPAAVDLGRQRLSDARDRGLAADIIHGTLRWQRALDAHLASTTRSGNVPPEPRLRVILRLSLYQILHLDRVPVSAVVDDAVELTRLAGHASASGFVNACLRSLLRKRRELALPPRPSDVTDRDAALAYLGITQSHPAWLVARWLDRLGLDAAERWVQFNNETPQVTLRANTLRTSREGLQTWLAEQGVHTRPTRIAPHGLVVESAADASVLHQPTDRFVFQDEASQLVSLLVDARPHHRVLDLCAAPGGKTSALAADMDDAGVLVACDVRPRRVRLLRSTLQRLQLSSPYVVQVDRSSALPFADAFDRVLVDAPCSGLGTIRRDPDVKWRRSPEDLVTLAAEQCALLHRAADVVAADGLLVYATCSSEPDENEAVVAAFLRERPDFAPDETARPLALAPVLSAAGHLRTSPSEHGLEPFFAAPLRRRARATSS